MAIQIYGGINPLLHSQPQSIISLATSGLRFYYQVPYANASFVL